MKIRFLLIGTSLSLIPQTINAQCVATQDCATLGYTETSCSGGSGVKCPFGNKWACFKSDSEIKDQLCTELGFTQACTGTNQTSGVGKVCNGKYNVCNCIVGYEWKDGNCQKPVLNGAQGELYYCNGTVVGVKTGDMDFYVAMEDLGNMTNDAAISACKKYIFCDGIKGVLPTPEQLLSIYKNKLRVNSLLVVNGGREMTEGPYWANAYRNKIVNMSDGSGSGYNTHDYVRPVLDSY